MEFSNSIRIFVSVFHRILDFKTRQHFYAAFFILRITTALSRTIYDTTCKYRNLKNQHILACSLIASKLLLIQKLIDSFQSWSNPKNDHSKSKIRKTKNPVSVNFFILIHSKARFLIRLSNWKPFPNLMKNKGVHCPLNRSK